MDRMLFTDRGGSQKRIADIWIMFTAGTAGAIPTTLDYAEFVSSIVLDSTGVISVHLQDAYIDVLEIDGSVAQGTPAATTAGYVVPDATTNVGSATDPKVVVRMLRPDTGAVANMVSGDVFRLHIALVH